MCLPKIRLRPRLLSGGGDVRRGSSGIQTSKENRMKEKRKACGVEQRQQLEALLKVQLPFSINSNSGETKVHFQVSEPEVAQFAWRSSGETGAWLRTMTVICCADLWPQTIAAVELGLSAAEEYYYSSERRRESSQGSDQHLQNKRRESVKLLIAEENFFLLSLFFCAFLTSKRQKIWKPRRNTFTGFVSS